MQNLTELAQSIHADNVEAGWWDDWPNKINRFETAMFLVISELVEAGEGVRKNLQDDHLPLYKMFDVELADTAIRLLDLAGAYEMKLSALMQTDIDVTVKQLKGMPNKLAQLFFIVQAAAMSRGFRKAMIRDTLVGVIALARLHKIPLAKIIDEKRAYNATRPDHQKAARATANGKKY